MILPLFPSTLLAAHPFPSPLDAPLPPVPFHSALTLSPQPRPRGHKSFGIVAENKIKSRSGGGSPAGGRKKGKFPNKHIRASLWWHFADPPLPRKETVACVPRALLTQPPENVNADGAPYLLAFLYFNAQEACRLHRRSFPPFSAPGTRLLSASRLKSNSVAFF